MRATITGFRGSGVCSRAPKSPRTSAWSISSSGPKSRALSSALRGIRPPCRPCGRNIRHTLDQPGKLPFSSPPRRATVSRSPTWPACPPTESYLIRSEKTRDKDLKERRDLDHQAHFFRWQAGAGTLQGDLDMAKPPREMLSVLLRSGDGRVVPTNQQAEIGMEATVEAPSAQTRKDYTSRPGALSRFFRALTKSWAAHSQLGKTGDLRCLWAPRPRRQEAQADIPVPLFMPDKGAWPK